MKSHRFRQQNNQPSGTPIYRHDGAAVIGVVRGDTFYKRARSSEHMLQRPRAWAADVDALDQAQAAGAVWVEVIDRDTGATYRAELADFYRRGVTVRRGHGDQLALPLACWDVTGGRVTTRPTVETAAVRPSQLRLF